MDTLDLATMVKRMFAVAGVFALSGCASVAIDTAHAIVDKARLQSNLEKAKAGDPTAQFVVGDALCCSGSAPEGSAYSTEKAIDWLCASADRGNADAMMKLGEIFSGDQTDGVRVMRRLLNAASGTPANLSAAYYWYTEAGEAGKEDGALELLDLLEEMTPAEQRLAVDYLTGVADRPCDWTDLVHGTSEAATKASRSSLP